MQCWQRLARVNSHQKNEQLRRLQQFAGPLAQGRVKITSICFLVDWLYPPYPPSRQLDPKFCLLGRGPTASRPLVTAFFVFLRASWNLPRHQSFLWSILPRKNLENQGFLAFQNRPKTHPKATQNRCPKNMWIFAIFGTMLI